MKSKHKRKLTLKTATITKYQLRGKMMKGEWKGHTSKHPVHSKLTGFPRSNYDRGGPNIYYDNGALGWSSSRRK